VIPRVLLTELTRSQVEWAHGLIRETYWAKGIPADTFARSVANSLAFVALEGDQPIAFGRAITDRATFAYLADIVVTPQRRGQGLGRWFVGALLAHPDLQGLRRICLMTRDAHALYARFGFEPMADASRYLQIHQPAVYAPSTD
jgi:N-acetylglutamate synthase-like GNAT family acetyltransferase